MKFTYWADTRKVVNTEDHALISKDVPRKYGHLLAAAPEMYEAIRNFIKLRKGDLGPDLATLEEAIATIPSQSGDTIE